MSKAWKRMSFWNKLRAILTALGAGGEFALILNQSDHSYKWIVGGATLAVILITHLIEDKDGNGLVDWWENKKAPNKEG
jgi:hypothetical protein